MPGYCERCKDMDKKAVLPNLEWRHQGKVSALDSTYVRSEKVQSHKDTQTSLQTQLI